MKCLFRSVGRWRVVLAVMLLGIVDQAIGSPSVPVSIDAHMHVHSPRILSFLPDYCASPGRTSKCDPSFTQPFTVDDALRELDEAGIRMGQLMSTGYLAESPMMVPARKDAPQLLRDANRFTVGLAHRYPDRFRAFIGINPVTATALPEIAYWKGNPDVFGVKIHITNSGVDLRSPDQLRKLAAVFRAAAGAHMDIVIHMRTRAKDYGSQDVRNFLSQVLPAAGDASVQIAHVGGWGGTDANTFAALGAFADALQKNPKLGRHLFFDMAVVFNEHTSAADLDRLVGLIRRIGVAHFLPGSDWPFSKGLAHYYGQVYPRLPLTRQEWDTIRRNTLPPTPR